MRVWRPKEGLVSCYYFISKSLLPSAKALCFFLSSLFLLYRISKHYLFLYSLLNIIMWLFFKYYFLFVIEITEGSRIYRVFIQCYIDIYIYMVLGS